MARCRRLMQHSLSDRPSGRTTELPGQPWAPPSLSLSPGSEYSAQSQASPADTDIPADSAFARGPAQPSPLPELLQNRLWACCHLLLPFVWFLPPAPSKLIFLQEFCELDGCKQLAQHTKLSKAPPYRESLAPTSYKPWGKWAMSVHRKRGQQLGHFKPM